jgi:hypothetical protein
LHAIKIPLKSGCGNAGQPTAVATTHTLRSSIIPLHPRLTADEPDSLRHYNGELSDVDNIESATDPDVARLAAVRSPLIAARVWDELDSVAESVLWAPVEILGAIYTFSFSAMPHGACN